MDSSGYSPVYYLFYHFSGQGSMMTAPWERFLSTCIKKGDLAGVFVYKFKCIGQLTLLAYEYDTATRKLLLLGSHENFYRNLKREG